MHSAMLGYSLWLGHRYDEAIKELRKTLDLDPAYEQTHIMLGRCYASKGLFPLAITEFQKAKALENVIAEPVAELWMDIRPRR